VVTGHDAFGYLTARYGLTQVPVTGLSPESEPSPGRLAEVTRLARDRGVTTIFFESAAGPRLAETLAREVGARAEVLDPVETVAPGTAEDYLAVMRANLVRLRAGLGCR
jgi:zinc transport system substrate-binding protein